MCRRRSQDDGMAQAIQAANARAKREAMSVIEAQQKAMDRMSSMVPEKPKYTPPPTQVRSSYADSGQGVKTAKRDRKKSNLGSLRIKLNPTTNMGGSGTGTGPNLG
jgi:hypothetical protein